MERNTKVKLGEAGITLVALVVTIIVLLILAGITIRLALSNNGIIQRAKDVSDTWANASANDETMMGELYNDIDKHTEGYIKLKGGKDTNGAERVADLEIGDYINYGEKLTIKQYETDTSKTGYGQSQVFETDNQMSWRVMSKKENGDVEIVSTINMLDNGGTIAGYDYDSGEYTYIVAGLVFSGDEGFLNAEDVLNSMCNHLYSSSYGTGRSINVDDINKLNNFNPETSEWNDLDAEEFVTIKTYGSLCEYTSGNVWDEENNEINTASSNNHLYARHTHYSYYLPTNMPLYDTLTSVSENDSSGFYWLASKCWNANNADNTWAYRYNKRIRFVGNGKNQTSSFSVRDWSDYSTDMGGYILSGPSTCGVRPVVTLNGNINIKNFDTKDGKTERDAYELE